MSGEAELQTGIVRLSLPTPFAVGRVNCYLIEDEPLTLVDAGPRSLEALDGLERLLAELGRRIEDIELLLLTHQHHDHTGLAGLIRQRSGAQVAATGLLAGFVADCGASLEADEEYQAQVLAPHGVPAETVAGLRDVLRSYRRVNGSVEVDRHLQEGDLVELAGRRLLAALRPGHSPTDTIFVDEQGRVALVGDHLIGHISSNPGVHRPPASPADPRRRAAPLGDYLDSLRRTAELEVDELLPGHGEPVTDRRSLIGERIKLHLRRKELMLEELRAGPQTGYELAISVWGEIAARQVFLTVSEALGHLDLLLAERLAREVDRNEGLIEFEALYDAQRKTIADLDALPDTPVVPEDCARIFRPLLRDLRELPVAPLRLGVFCRLAS